MPIYWIQVVNFGLQSVHLPPGTLRCTTILSAQRRRKHEAKRKKITSPPLPHRTTQVHRAHKNTDPHIRTHMQVSVLTQNVLTPWSMAEVPADFLVPVSKFSRGLVLWVF